MNLCVIPARGGSKRIPKKNIKNFCGKPIIAWSIEQAIKSKCFDKIIVSTDDKDIAKIAKSYGAEIPFVRPKKISQYLIKLLENDLWKLKMNNNAISAYEKYFAKDKILSKWSNVL